MFIVIPRIRQKKVKPGQDPDALNPTFLSAFAYFLGIVSAGMVLLAEKKNTNVRYHGWISLLLSLSWLGTVVLLVIVGIVTPTPVSHLCGKLIALVTLLTALIYTACFWAAIFGKSLPIPLLVNMARRRAGFES